MPFDPMDFPADPPKPEDEAPRRGVSEDFILTLMALFAVAALILPISGETLVDTARFLWARFLWGG